MKFAPLGPSLQSLSGVDNIDPLSIDLLLIYDNPGLSFCAIESVCEAITNPASFVYFNFNDAGCSTMNEVIEACETISVSENRANQLFIVYVNEQQHQLEIFQEFPEFEFLLVDVMGKVIYTASLNSGFHGVNISGFESGIYIAIGQTQGSQIDVKKIIVK